jgi:hypothetical protein
MLDRAAAREIAQRKVPDGLAIADDRVVELDGGWFFPYRTTSGRMAGSQGVVVNKTTGKLFPLGSAFPVERDLILYDKGYQSDQYDLVVRAIADMERTLDVLEYLGIAIVEPKDEHGAVWRIPPDHNGNSIRSLENEGFRAARLPPCRYGRTSLLIEQVRRTAGRRGSPTS